MLKTNNLMTKNNIFNIIKNCTKKKIIKQITISNTTNTSFSKLIKVMLKSGNSVSTLSFLFLINNTVLYSKSFDGNKKIKSNNTSLLNLINILSISDLGLFIKQRKVSRKVRKYSKGKLRFKSSIITIRKRNNIGHYWRFSRLLALSLYENSCQNYLNIIEGSDTSLNEKNNLKKKTLLSLLESLVLDFFNKNSIIRSAQTKILSNYLNNGCKI